MCSSEDEVTLEAWVDNLNDDVFVRETNHKAILGRITEHAV
jgi:hypothetical protein